MTNNLATSKHSMNMAHGNHAKMFRNKFFIALNLSIPILILSPMGGTLDAGLFGISFIGQRWFVGMGCLVNLVKNKLG